MSCASGTGSKAWFIAASVGAIEGLKDQGFCRGKIQAIRSRNQRVYSNQRSYYQDKNLTSAAAAAAVGPSKARDEKAQQSDESLRKVMYLSCWGPY